MSEWRSDEDATETDAGAPGDGGGRAIAGTADTADFADTAGDAGDPGAAIARFRAPTHLDLCSCFSAESSRVVPPQLTEKTCRCSPSSGSSAAVDGTADGRVNLGGALELGAEQLLIEQVSFELAAGLWVGEAVQLVLPARLPWPHVERGGGAHVARGGGARGGKSY